MVDGATVRRCDGTIVRRTPQLLFLCYPVQILLGSKYN
jgi:hypothetical protein